MSWKKGGCNFRPEAIWKGVMTRLLCAHPFCLKIYFFPSFFLVCLHYWLFIFFKLYDRNSSNCCHSLFKCLRPLTFVLWECIALSHKKLHIVLGTSTMLLDFFFWSLMLLKYLIYISFIVSVGSVVHTGVSMCFSDLYYTKE